MDKDETKVSLKFSVCYLFNATLFSISVKVLGFCIGQFVN